ncbi:hypothetical protein TIFTF001_034114 [Ficus carica]|uniref:Retrotransposon gag domain-containing protein n=1 Tax=Ficus carica TaxID=3494 RepID=A0AA88E271_FICCA|nr:hypothetical protein TIFTF001_034114 [Ficus carica]
MRNEHSSSMAMTGNDTPDAFKGLLHPGMEYVGYWDDIGWCLSLVVATRAMPPKRRKAQTQDVDLAAQMNELRQMMLAQQQEIGGLKAQLAQQNQGPPDAGVPPAPVNQPAAPEIPDVDPVNPENPIAPEVPVAPVAVPPAPLARTPEELYDKFRRMKAPEFEGSTNPIEADNWLIDLQVVINFLRLNDQEKVLCMTWEDFVEEFKEKYFNTEVMEAQQDEFDKFRQGNLSVAEAVKKFEQLARLYPHLISSERDKVRRMMRMFCSDLAVVISSGPHPPLTVAECVSRAIQAEYWVGQNKEQRAKFFKEKREEKTQAKQNQARLGQTPQQKVNEDLWVKTTITSNTATTNRRGNGMQEDRGINRIFPKRRMLLIATVIPLVRNVGGGTREIAVLKPVAAFYVARKATMLELAISIPRIHRTNREDRDLNFMQHR